MKNPAVLPAVMGLLSLCVAPAGAASLREAIASDYAYLESLFEHLHANPELSMQEAKTSDRLARELEPLGFSLTRNIGKTGLVGTLRNGAGPVVLIRADMDALPVPEKTGLDYASKARQVNLEGVDMPVMHACGHDMHVTSLVGVARRMVELKDRWRGTLLEDPQRVLRSGRHAARQARFGQMGGTPFTALRDRSREVHQGGRRGHDPGGPGAAGQALRPNRLK
jgi:Peptidase family M20/M25/M40